MATGILADQGAEVIKIEAAGGDLTRRVGPHKEDLSALFIAINRGKRAITLDLKQPAARGILLDLLRTADVVVENFRPGAMDKLGLSYKEVSAVNPKIIYVSISGFGQTGPCADRRAYDPVIQAVSAFAAAHPNTDTDEPELLQSLICDKVTALTAAQAISSALYERSASGVGKKVDVSMLDASLAFLWPDAFYNYAFLDNPPRQTPEFGAFQKLWKARNGWFAVMTPQDGEFAAMCRVFGMEHVATDPRFSTATGRRFNQAEMRALLEPAALDKDVDSFVAELAAAGVPVGRVNTKANVHEDAQVVHNGTLLEQDYPDMGRVRSPRSAAIFNGEAGGRDCLAPKMGEHSRDILAALGKDAAEIDSLFASRAVQ
jgi:crotonobetainyl-CoA:carnitine CoA-transferase CaiB-like acyl-CoA transferase